MPSRYLLLEPNSGVIVATDAVPGAPFTETFKDPAIFMNLVDVWCVKGTTADAFRAAAAVFAGRAQLGKICGDVVNAVAQLQGLYSKDGTGYLAVGASPKLIKWLMKRRGFNVVTVNVSKVKFGVKRTSDFEAYLRRKLAKLEQAGAPARLVIMDYADEGESLAQLKVDVKELRPSAEVIAVATGCAPGFHKGTHKDHIDRVLADIPHLAADTETQRLKTHVIGRNKVKNDYATWSSDTAAKLMPDTVGVARGAAYFQAQKGVLPAALELPIMDVKIAQFLDMGDDDEKGDGGSGSDSDSPGFDW